MFMRRLLEEEGTRLQLSSHSSLTSHKAEDDTIRSEAAEGCNPPVNQNKNKNKNKQASCSKRTFT